MTFKQLLQGIPYTGTAPQGEAALVTQDSRKVTAGAVFVCIVGRGHDGHDYAPAALKAGAGLLVTQRPLGLPNEVTVKNSRLVYAQLCQAFFGNPAAKLKLVAVTGTNGKTTVTNLVKQILKHQGIRCGLIGTNQSEINGMSVPAKFTTPDAWDLNALFARMVAAECTHVVMEASSQALDQGRLAGLQFDLAVFTNLSPDHLDWHGDMQAYYNAKKILFSQCNHMLVNMDDPWGRRLLGECEGVAASSYSLQNDNAGFVAHNVSLRPSGVRFAFLHNNSLEPVRFAMPGEYSVYNALAAAASAVLLGIEPADAAEALRASNGVAGRCEVLYSGDYTVIRDFAHTGDAIQKLLATLRPFTEGRLIVLFGCAGDRDASKRPAMGQAAADYGDIIYLSADNPRTENVEKTMTDALAPIQASGKPYYLVADRETAVCSALAELQAGDMLVLCGKGHEDYQVLKGVTVYLSEKQIVENWLAEKQAVR